MANAQQVLEQVNRYINTTKLEGVYVKAIAEGIRQEEDYWYVPVTPTSSPPSTSIYYELLAELETKLLEFEHLNVLFIPTTPDEDVA